MRMRRRQSGDLRSDGDEREFSEKDEGRSCDEEKKMFGRCTLRGDAPSAEGAASILGGSSGSWLAFAL